MKTKKCTIDGCGGVYDSRGMCHKHYEKWRRHNPVDRPPTPRSNPEFRFWSKVDKSGDCWIWGGTKSDRGYGAFKFNGKAVGAHRYAWQSVNGEIPTGLEIDHQCRVTSCVNPSHLKLVTRGENQQNTGMPKSNTSGHKGVYWKKKLRKWAAQVAHEGVQMHLGYFDSAAEAGLVARNKRNELQTNNLFDREEDAIERNY